MAIDFWQLYAQAGSGAARRGQSYLNEGRVTINDMSAAGVKATVSGSYGSKYAVRVTFDDADWNHISHASCDCPAWDSSTQMCKHVVATAMAASTLHECSGEPPYYIKLADGVYEKMDLSRPSSDSAVDLISTYAERIAHDAVRPAELPTHDAKIEATLHYDASNSAWRDDDIYLTFKVGREKLYVLKDVSAFRSAFSEHGTIELGKRAKLLCTYDAFDPKCHALLDFILNTRPYDRSAYMYNDMRKAFYLDRRLLSDFICMHDGQTLSMAFDKDAFKCHVRQGNPAFRLELTEDGAGYKLACDHNYIYMRGHKHMFLIDEDHTLYICDDDYTDNCSDLFYALATGGNMYFAKGDVGSLFSSVIPLVEPYVPIDIAQSAYELAPAPLQASIYFDLDEDDGVLARLQFAYGEEVHDAFEDKDILSAIDLGSETRLEDMVSAYMGYKLVSPGTLLQDDEDAIYMLLSEGLERLSRYMDVYATDAFNRLEVHAPIALEVGVHVEGRLLECDLNLEGVDFSELADILSSYRAAKRYHRLSDGSFLQLDDKTMDTIVELTDGLDVSLKELQSGHLSVDMSRSLYLDGLLKRSSGIRYERDDAFKGILRSVRDFEDATYEVPASLSKVLRTYQETGYVWMRMLSSMGLGVILADEMGLGKTLQVLTLLQALKDEREADGRRKVDDACDAAAANIAAAATAAATNAADAAAGIGTAAVADTAAAGAASALPAMVVCPASLVYNWQAECEKFTPGLTLGIIAGARAERHELIEHIQSYDIVVTSYDLLRQDIEQYVDAEFSYVILDEAQYIKNHTTQNAKAVKVLKGAHRLALTGTPVENNLAELWSVFDFLMPGYLFNYHKFKQRFETPIVRYKDEQATARLRDMVAPFILRRVKGDVLQELPRKIEQFQYVEMEDVQRKLYIATLARTKADLYKRLKAAGSAQGRMVVLAALTRLRQICCDPHLVFEDYDGASAKLDACMELVEQCIDGGHRMLLFSQFTSMLDIIKKELNDRNIAYYLLQGSTPKLERMNMTERFNADDTPVFLISLKAGGTGLNLTGADVVIHYDPWWNLSAQNQATDRTHRIGQDKRVQVFKLIVKGTIEERIVDLQNAKAELAESIIQSGGSAFEKLSQDELLALFDDRDDEE